MGPHEVSVAPLAGETAILITAREGAPIARATTRLLYAGVCRSSPDPSGRVAWVPPGHIVAYAVHALKPRTFVFRTASVRRGELLTRIPGVAPQVVLLVHAATLPRQALIARFFDHLLRTNREPSALTDRLFLQINAVLARRSPSMGALEALLQQHDQPVL